MIPVASLFPAPVGRSVMSDLKQAKKTENSSTLDVSRLRAAADDFLTCDALLNYGLVFFTLFPDFC